MTRKRDLQSITIELEGIAEQLSMIGYSICGEGFRDVDITDRAVASQLWSIANFLDRITEDIEEIDQAEAQAELEELAIANGFVVAQTGDGEATLLTELE